MNEKTKIEGEETQVKNTPASEQKKSSENIRKQKMRESLLSAGGVVVGGGVMAAAMSFTEGPESEASGGTSGMQGASIPVVHDSAPIAETVTDEMPFGEAYGTARNEVGPGGIFEWHGKIYSTYSAEEWASMTPEEKTEFNQSYQQALIDNPELTVEKEETDEVVVKPEQPQVVIPKPEETVKPEVTDDLPEVLAVEELETGETAFLVDLDGDLSTGEAILVDVDVDGIVDTMIVMDEEGNPVNIDISEREISVSALMGENSSDQDQTDDNQENTLASLDDNHLPDYMNDADVSDLA